MHHKVQLKYESIEEKFPLHNLWFSIRLMCLHIWMFVKNGKFIFSLTRVDFEIWTTFLHTCFALLFLFFIFILLACLPSLECMCVCMLSLCGYGENQPKISHPKSLILFLNDVYTLLLRPTDIIYHYLSSMKNERKCEVKKYLETRNQFSQLKIQSTSWQFF